MEAKEMTMLIRRGAGAAGLLAALLSGAAPAVGEVLYEITDLGSVVFPYAINSSAQVVGDRSGPVFLWDDGVFTDLGMSGWAYDINDSTQVVGIQTGGWSQAYVWDDGDLALLGTFGGPVSQAYGINDLGQIVGAAELPDRAKRAFLYENGLMTDLGDFGGPQSWAFGINNAGNVVGSADTDLTTPSGYPIQRAFLYQNGSFTQLAGDFSTAYAVNESGQIVGKELGHGFFWENGVLTDLGWHVFPASINDQGQIVGRDSSSQSDMAFVWDNGAPTDLIDLIPGDSGWRSLQYATDINGAGQIVGWGELDNGTPHAFLLTPVPEPASISILTLGAILAKRRATAQ